MPSRSLKVPIESEQVRLEEAGTILGRGPIGKFGPLPASWSLSNKHSYHYRWFIQITVPNMHFGGTGWFRSTLGFDLLGFRSILVSICTRYQFQTAHYSIYTNSDLHSFRSALFSLCNFWICKDFALLSIRSAQISICTDFDLHVFRYANQF